MPPRKKTPQEKVLEKRERDRAYRLKIKSDPLAYEAAKKKEHERYLKRKSKGELKSVNELSERDKRIKRKKWKSNSKRYRQNVKAKNEEDERLEMNTPPPSPQSDIPNQLQARDSSNNKKDSGKKKRRQHRRILNNKIKELEKKLRDTKKSKDKYKKRYERLKVTKKQNVHNPSPGTKCQQTLKLLGKREVHEEVKKKLLFAEVMKDHLVSQYKSTTSIKFKNNFKRNMGINEEKRKVLKKYRLMGKCRQFLGRTTYKVSGKSAAAIPEKIISAVRDFFDSDQASRMCPGKSDCVTFKKEKRQKRLLNDSMKNLHKEFVNEHKYNLSYVTFTRLKPFWVKEANVEKRDTCLCTQHENMRLIVEKLSYLNAIDCKEPNEIAKQLCCNGKEKNETCLASKCNRFKDKTIPFEGNDDTRVAVTSYKQWVNKLEKRTVHGGKEIVVKITKKEQIFCCVEDMYNDFLKKCRPFLRHVMNIAHQFKTLQELKNGLQETKAVCHIDFSENYGCKYDKEVQSVHFGASRSQVTLHTGVLYFSINGKTEHSSFCTISASNRHDSAAVWAHLKPILEDISGKLPKVNTIHFISDSPSTQYRNKTMYYLVTKRVRKINSSIKEVTWNYTESGHGKGAPDGVGGLLKRSADKAVACGSDITNVDELFLVLQSATDNVKLILVSENEIQAIDSELKSVTLDTFQGTMKTHQVTWNHEMPDKIDLRTLSCFQCATNEKCSHYSLGKLWDVKSKSPKTTTDNNKVSKKVRYEEVYTDSEDEPDRVNIKERVNKFQSEPGTSNETKSNSGSFSNLEIHDWCLVRYEKELFPGEILRKIVPNQVEVSCMVKAGNYWKWPKNPDVLVYQIEEVKSKLNPPQVVNARGYYKFE